MIQIDLMTAAERLHGVVHKHRDAAAPTAELVADVCKALGVTARLVLVEERAADPRRDELAARQHNAIVRSGINDKGVYQNPDMEEILDSIRRIKSETADDAEFTERVRAMAKEIGP